MGTQGQQKDLQALEQLADSEGDGRGRVDPVALGHPQGALAAAKKGLV